MIDSDGLSLCPLALEEDETTLRVQVNDPDGAAALDSISFENHSDLCPNCRAAPAQQVMVSITAIS